MNSTAFDTSKSTFKRICVILNPANDPQGEVEVVLRNAFETCTGEWIIRKTESTGDAQRFAEQAQLNQSDLVIACGGDGTVREVATALRGSNVLMAILPNGTANVLASELDIPYDKDQVISALLNGDYKVRDIDMGKVDDEYFILRIGIGYEAEISVGATREDKRRFGRFAYFASAARQIRGLKSTRYELNLDGETMHLSGITCMISNSSNVGIPNVNFSSNTDISDGLLDVTVIEDMYITTVLGFLRNILVSIIPLINVKYAPAQHFQAKNIIIKTSRNQTIAVDGEPFRRDRRLEVSVLPSAVRVAVPIFEETKEA